MGRQNGFLPFEGRSRDLDRLLFQVPFDEGFERLGIISLGWEALPKLVSQGGESMGKS